MTTITTIRPAALIFLASLAMEARAVDAPATEEGPFLAENRVAMDRMMTGMDVVPTGTVDRDFARMMIPHHQGAIDMARADLRYGKNPVLRRIA